MSRHRHQPGRRKAPAPGRRRAPARPRYGRIAVASSALAVTLVAVLTGVGMLPDGERATADDQQPAAGLAAVDDPTTTPPVDPDPTTTTAAPDEDPTQAPQPTTPDDADRPTKDRTKKSTTEPTEEPDPLVEDDALPEDSGEGRRVVFSESRQRVWLVDDAGEVERTYLASGSVYDDSDYDNLVPGTYSVFSRSEHAVGIDDSGTMDYFVRFTRSPRGAAIGFHDIPVDDGAPVQTVDQLGTPLSHGCIRQDEPDAIAMWEFAPLGTTVVVTA